MASQNQIRQAFTNHWCHPSGQAGKNAWLIKGDFDRFKLMNELYGSLLCDYLLDWTLDVIEAELTTYQKACGSPVVLWSFVGDDVTIYIPPSTLQEDEIENLLWKICGAIEISFFHRYRVGALPLSPSFFEDVPTDSLEAMRNEFEKMDVVLDFAGRQQGFLILLPVDADVRCGEVLQSVLQVIQNGSGKPVPSVELQADWIWDPDGDTCHTFNEGYLQSPSISFAACSVLMGEDIRFDPYDRRSLYERVSLACQSVLKECKEQRKRVLVHHAGSALLEVCPSYQPNGVLALYSPLRWSSERYLRETLYFRQLDQPVLFQFNPVYRSNSTLFTSAIPDDTTRVAKYRGNKYGIGLKGINEIFGQCTADCLIGELTWVFSKVLQSALVGKGIPLGAVHVARFVDRFTVCCEQPVFHLLEVTELVRRLAELFNSVSNEIKISNLRISLVFGEHHIVGYRLFHQLALTSRSPQSILLETLDPPVELHQTPLDFNLQEGSIVLERNTCASARLLDAYNERLLQRPHTKNLLLSEFKSRLYIG